MKVKVVNCTVSSSFPCNFDLKLLHSKIKGSKYVPTKFSALIYKYRRASILLFNNGKMILTGIRSSKEAWSSIRKLEGILFSNGYPVLANEYKLTNIVGSWDMQCPVDLVRFANTFKLESSFEPELFPGLFYKRKDSGTSATIFRNGKVFLTGCKSKKHLTLEYENVLEAIKVVRDMKMRELLE